MRKTNGFIVILPAQILKIPKSSNLSWLRLFSSLPRELVKKSQAFLNLPRNIRQVLENDEYHAMIQNDSFLELVWDCYVKQ